MLVFALRQRNACNRKRLLVLAASVQEGPNVVQFPDGGQVTFNMPYVRMGGFLWGDRVVEWLGEMTFRDDANSLMCVEF